MGFGVGFADLLDYVVLWGWYNILFSWVVSLVWFGFGIWRHSVGLRGYVEFVWVVEFLRVLVGLLYFDGCVGVMWVSFVFCGLMGFVDWHIGFWMFAGCVR